MRRSLIPALLLAVVALSGCTAGPTAQTPPGPTEATVQSDRNVNACSDLESLWDDVEERSTTPGNTDGDGRPTATATAPNYRLKLDQIRQTTQGTLRTALDAEGVTVNLRKPLDRNPS